MGLIYETLGLAVSIQINVIFLTGGDFGLDDLKDSVDGGYKPDDNQGGSAGMMWALLLMPQVTHGQNVSTGLAAV